MTVKGDCKQNQSILQMVWTLPLSGEPLKLFRADKT